MHLKILLKKELQLELRSMETFWGILGMSVLLSVVAAFGLESAVLTIGIKQKMFAGTIWLISFCSASLFIPKSFEREWRYSGLSALLLRGVLAEEYFIAKVISLSLITWFAHLLLSIILAVLLNLNLTSDFALFLLISFPILFAFNLISSLFAPLSYRSRLGSSMLTLISIPTLFPLLLSAIEITQNLILENQLPLFWTSLLGFLTILYLFLGMLLAKYTYSC